jgi:putative (di)nucleoside polyphosphate hydrolase
MARDLAQMNYRPCVGVALFNAEGHVFAGRRRPDRGTDSRDQHYEWQMPQGGIDSGEDPYLAAVRELYEETNIRSIQLLGEAPDWYRYDLPSEIMGRALKGRFRGQTQKWFAFRFTGAESEIDVVHPGGGAHRPEFVAWKWERLEAMPELIVPFKRGVYEQVARVFAPFAKG